MPVAMQVTHQSTMQSKKASTAHGTQALGEVTGLQRLEVSQCSGVTEEGLLELMPCWPALTHLNFDCLHLTAEHVGTLAKVPP